MNDDIRKYLLTITSHCKAILGENLLGLYLYGSQGTTAFIPDKSDLDILGVVKNSIVESKKKELAQILGHSSLPVPAAGLELLIVNKTEFLDYTGAPSYEFSLATGQTWGTHTEYSGSSTNIPVYAELSRLNSKTLYGESAATFFDPVTRDKILTGILHQLQRHQVKLESLHQDLDTEHYVLNAARALQYLQEGLFSSKNDGGSWLLKKEPQNLVVRNSLDKRLDKTTDPINQDQALSFIKQTIALLEAELQK